MSPGSCAKGRFPRATWACDNHVLVGAVRIQPSPPLSLSLQGEGDKVGPSGPSTLMKIAIASDHAGYRLKEDIKLLLRELGHEVRDFGTHSGDPVDYPDFIAPAAEAVSRGECEQGIVLGGAGNGVAMVGNKEPGMRSARWLHAAPARAGGAPNKPNHR